MGEVSICLPGVQLIPVFVFKLEIPLRVDDIFYNYLGT